MKFRPRHNDKDQEKWGAHTAIDFTGDPGKTLQEPADDADINILMKRMGVTDGSQLPYFQNPRAMYGDFTEVPTDPTELANMVRAAELEFMMIPAEIRQRYRGPEDLFNYLNNPENYDEAVKLGLLAERETPPKSQIDTLVEKIDTLVSSSTGSDKEKPVPPSKGGEK
jgi:hypothetical protein